MPSKDIHTLSLRDITPPNLAQDSQVSGLIDALDPELQAVSQATLEALLLSRIDELSEEVLDLLAWQMHVDFYDLAGTLSMKRDAVKGSLLWHMHKGTEWAIMEALRMIDIKAEFVPWYESGEDPYTFKLRAIVSGDFYRTKGRDQLIRSIRRAVEESKAARSYMTSLETQIYFHEDVNILYAGVPILSGERRILLPKVSPPDSTVIYSGTAKLLSGNEIIRQWREVKHESRIYSAQITIQNTDMNIGVELGEMQELLRQFERRIFERIDNSERAMLASIEANHKDITAQLEEVKEMLRWQENDQEAEA